MKKSLSALFLITLLGCNIGDLDIDNLKGPTLNSRVAVPIGEVTYTMRELLDELGDEQLGLQEDSASLLQISYFDTATFSAAGDIISINDVSNSASIDIPAIPASLDSRQEVIDTVFTFVYPASENEDLDSIFYNEGNLLLNINSNVSSELAYSLDISNTRLVSSGDPVNFTGNLSSFGSESQSQTLAGHKTDLLFENGTNTFQVAARFTIFLSPGASTSPGESISMTITYADQSFNLLYGKFGQDTLDVGDEELDIGFFKDLGDKGLKFGNPRIKFNFDNTFGLPLGVLFNRMYGVDSTSRGYDTTFLTGDVAERPQLIAGSVAPGVDATSTILLDRNNSSLQDFLAGSPQSLGFDLRAIANPEDGSVSNFVMDSSRITTFIEITLPMELALDDAVQNVSFDLGSGLKFDEADSVTIRIVSENELPLSADVLLSIVDENDSTLYTAQEAQVLQAPFLDQSGGLDRVRQLTTDIPVSKQGIEALGNGKKMKLALIMNTPKGAGTNDFFVKILADYALNVKVAVVGKLAIDL
ncbi:hypothetical protein [Marinoscillum furvescens]|uniref:Uncharacterized protein n=1 Tax=Marinoscillum furvescens DSM 4134 TaxID=1122208 RepID=A0A3D9L613_MARFU|nr:hypothetical protein [Marinoscillum furvescens]REE00408.1 hypothetical protein C7460_10529 [Marinoscillum furvescens DSM 4134]